MFYRVPFLSYCCTSRNHHWGLQGYTLFFLFLLIKHRLWVLVRSGSNEYPQYSFQQIYEKYQSFNLKIFSFWSWNCLCIWIGVFSNVSGPCTVCWSPHLGREIWLLSSSLVVAFFFFFFFFFFLPWFIYSLLDVFSRLRSVIVTLPIYSFFIQYTLDYRCWKCVDGKRVDLTALSAAIEPQRTKKYLLICAPTKTQIILRSPESDQNLRCPFQETLHPWLSKTRPAKILIRLRECAVWSESSLGAHIRKYVSGHFGSFEKPISNRLHVRLSSFFDALSVLLTVET